MTARRPLKPSPAKLRAAFKKDLASAWSFFRRKRPKHVPYAFVLYGTEGSANFSPQVLTEQGLTEVARRYLREGYYDNLDEARAGLRYSVPDSPLFEELLGQLPTVDALLEPYADTLEETSGYALLAKAAMAALEELDGERLFGAGADRKRLLLVIITEDTEEDWSAPSARRLNPKAVFQRFEKETRVEGVYAECNSLAVAPDGRSLYMTGSRDKEDEDQDPDQDSDAEVVAFKVQGRRLVRRWTSVLPGDGDAGGQLAQLVYDPDGQSVILLREKSDEDACETVLMRFGTKAGKLQRQCSLAGDPASFAVSADGSRLAVAMRDKSLHVLDREFRLLHSGQVKFTPNGTLFLRSQQLLVATDKRLLRIDPMTCAVKASVPLSCFTLSTDEHEKLLAVSEMNVRESRYEFCVRVLSLPNLKSVRAFRIPGHQAAGYAVALSPDGRLLAFEVKPIGKHQTFVTVVNTATGREIGRKKADMVNDLAFLRDNRTLAIAKNDITKFEATELWVIPGL
jgi:hypothetical protein